MNLHELAMYKALNGEGGGSSVTVEPLEITENGTYSEEGKAYSPVTVNVEGRAELKAFVERTMTEFSNSDVTRIGACSFYYNTVITSVNVPNATVIQGSAFRDAKNLASVSAENVTDIASQAFYGCTALTDVTGSFPKLKYLGAEAFRGSKLTKFVSPLCTFVGSNAFNGLTTLKLVCLPSGGMRGACYGCTNLETVDTLTYIGNDASTYQGVTVQSFYNCAKLATVIIRRSSVVPLSDINAFQNTPFASGKTGGTLYVPNDLIASYQSATNWSTILGYSTNQILPIEGSIYETQYADGTPIE